METAAASPLRPANDEDAETAEGVRRAQAELARALDIHFARLGTAPADRPSGEAAPPAAIPSPRAGLELGPSWTERQRPIRRRLLAAFIAGAALGPLVAGAAHLAPAAWSAPDRLAALVLGSDRWTGGERLMANADPERWRDLVSVQALAADACPGSEADAARPCTPTLDAARIPARRQRRSAHLSLPFLKPLTDALTKIDAALPQ